MGRWLFGSACMVVGILIGVSVRDVPAAAQVECAQVNGDVDGNGKLAIADALLILQYVFNAEAQRPDLVPHCVPPCLHPLPATGQTECYGYNPDAEKWEMMDCASPEFPGQDAFYRAGCPAEGRFVDNGDGTVTDRCTGLMWQQETAPGTDRWPQALRYCEDLELAGYTDWRLPNVRELQSIVDYGRLAPAIDTRFFSAVLSWYWSSSTFAGSMPCAWHIHFWDGDITDAHKDNDYHVRAVRGGL